MYFWNEGELIVKISRNEITEREKFNYFLVWGVFAAIGTSLGTGNSLPIITLIEFVVEIVLLLIFLRQCFDVNKVIDNCDFTSRIIMFSLPISIKLFIFAFIPAIIIMSLGEGYQLLVTFALSLIYWLWLKSCFEKLEEIGVKPLEDKFFKKGTVKGTLF